MADNTYMDVVEVAAILHRSHAAVRNLVYRKQIPFRKPGGRLLFIRKEIEVWIEQAEGIHINQLMEG